MELNESAEDSAFRTEVRKFVDEHLPDDIRRKVLYSLRLELDDLQRWHRILHQRGWAAPSWPVSYGGTGWSPIQRAIFEAESMGAGAPRMHPTGVNMLGPILQKFGTAEQKARFLPPILPLDHFWCQGYSEPGAGSDLASLRTRAELKGDRYVVNGQKIWTSFAAMANWMFCLVRTSNEGRQQEGITFLLIDMQTKGLRMRPITSLDGATDQNEFFFDDVEVPVDMRVGQENKGWSIAKYLLSFERFSVAGVGTGRRLLWQVKTLASEVMSGGKPLIDDQRFRERLAEAEINVVAQEWNLMRALSLEAAGRLTGSEASILKLRGSDIHQELSELLMECCGPYGRLYDPTVREFGKELGATGHVLYNSAVGNYFDSRKVSLYGGTTEVQKNIIGRTAIGL